MHDRSQVKRDGLYRKHIGETRIGRDRAWGNEDATPARQEPPRSRSSSATQGCAQITRDGPGSPISTASQPHTEQSFRLVFASSLLKSILPAYLCSTFPIQQSAGKTDHGFRCTKRHIIMLHLSKGVCRIFSRKVHMAENVTSILRCMLWYL